MTSTVRDLFASVELTPVQPVRWGTAPTSDRPGVYLIATSADPDEPNGFVTAPIAASAVANLLVTRPELTLRGVRPDSAQVMAALESMWVPGAVVLYAGKAGTSLRSRVSQYYRTKLGARSPHAGGWPLKTLASLGKLHVHTARCDDPKAAEVLARMIPGVRSSVAQSMEDERLSDLLEIMPPDEAADVLGALPRDKAQVLLSLMGLDEAGVVRELLGYDPDTAGGRMTTEFVAIADSMTTEETLEHLQRRGEEAETIYYVYVVDSEGHLSGVLSLRDLLRAPPGRSVGGLMMRDVVTTQVDDDQEVAAERLSRYNLLALPVVDEDHVLKGIVTVDDAIDVMIEESSEDFSQLSGVPLPEGGRRTGVLDVRRWAGTMLTFLGGVLATALFGIFRNEFVAAIAIVYFVPLALRAAHDVSVWSLRASVRDLRREVAAGGDGAGTIAREYLYTLAAAAVISVLGFSISVLWGVPLTPAIAGGAGLFVGIAIAGILGLLVPGLLRRARPEPAVAPGPLVGVIVMAVSAVAFLLVSGLFLKAF